jgi:tetratricopeptide (TPR) repeat protein
MLVLLALWFVPVIALCEAQSNGQALQQARRAAVNGQWNEAIEFYNQARDESPKVARVELELANALAQVGRYPEAIDSYQQVLTLQPGELNAQLGLGQMFQAVSNADSARKMFELATRDHPLSAEAWKTWGGFDIAQDRYQDAIAHLSRAGDLQPDNTAIEIGLATAYDGVSQSDRAMPLVNRVLRRAPRNALALFLRATIESSQNQNDAALQDAKLLLTLRPDQERTRLLVAKLLLREEQCKEAATVLKPVDRREHSSPDVLFLMGRALQCSGEPELAQDYRNRFAASEERKKQNELSHSAAHQLVTEAAEQASRKDYSNALTLVSKALEQEPGNADAYSLRAKVFLSLDKLAEADEAIRKALLQKPNHPGYLRVQGMVLEAEGEYGKALEEFHKSVLIDPEEAESFFQMGRSYARLGRHAEALAAYNQAIHLAPQQWEYRRAAEEYVSKIP